EPHPVDAPGGGLPPVRHLVDAGDEVEVLEDREVLVEAEALGHVAHLPAHQRRVADDVEAEAGSFAPVRREQAAQQPDGGGLAAAVGAEEAADLAGRHLQGEALDHLAGAEALAQVAHVDNEAAERRLAVALSAGNGLTSSGWAGLMSRAWSDGGRASIR